MSFYRYTYDKNTGDILSVDNLDYITSEDYSIFEGYCENPTLYYVSEDRILTRTSEEAAAALQVDIEENIVPLGETEGVSKESDEGRAAEAEYAAREEAASETATEEVSEEATAEAETR